MLKKLLLSSLLLALAAPAALATPLVVGGGSESFTFGISGLASDQNPFTFTGPALLTITDGFNIGDQFSVYDGFIFLGTTSAPGAVGDNCSDYASCIADPSYSHGTFLLGNGSHAINLFATQSPFGTGTAFINADPVTAIATTPEPGSFVLLGTGLLGVAGAMRRRIFA